MSLTMGHRWHLHEPLVSYLHSIQRFGRVNKRQPIGAILRFQTCSPPFGLHVLPFDPEIMSGGDVNFHKMFGVCSCGS